MGGCSGHMGMREWRRIKSCRNQTCEMRHIHKQIGPDRVSDFTHFLEINNPWDSRAARNDHFRLMGRSQLCHLIIIKQTILLAHAILNRVKPFPRLIGGRAMGQVTAGIKAHAQDGVAWL